MAPIRSAVGGALAAVVLAALAAVAVISSSRGSQNGRMELMSVADLPRLDAEIQRDVELLRAQQAVVRRAEALASGAGNVNGNRMAFPQAQAPVRHQFVAAGRVLSVGQAYPGHQSLSRREASASPEGDHSYVAEVRAVNRHLGDMDRAHRQNALRWESDYDQKKVDEWGEFFDHLNTEVDVPKYNVKNLVVDNIMDITPCNQDCDKEGTDNPAEFDWFDKLNAVNAKGKVIDNLDGITACTIDC